MSVTPSSLLACPVCDGTDFREALVAEDMRHGGRYPVDACAGCGVWRTRDPRDPATLGELYGEGDAADAGARGRGLVEAALRALRRRRVRQILRRRSGPGKILDVGCGRGVMLAELARRGWTVVGTEVSEAVARTARASLPEGAVRVGAVTDLDFDEAPFDVITLWHVLEHVADPGATLGRLRDLLAEDGLLIVAIPNNESAQARLFGRHWLHLDVPRHRWHFGTATLGRLAARHGLMVAATEQFSLEYGPFGMLQGALGRAGLGSTLYARLVEPSGRPLWREPMFFAHLGLAAPIAAVAAAALPLEAAAALLSRGGCITAFLQKRGAG